MNKIILTGLRNLMTDEVIKPQRDYALMLVAARTSEEKVDGEENCYKYRLKMDRIDSIMDLREHEEIKFQKGKSDSQQYRWLVISKLGDTEYNNYMGWLKANSDRHTEEYLDQLKEKI